MNDIIIINGVEYAPIKPSISGTRSTRPGDLSNLGRLSVCPVRVAHRDVRGALGDVREEIMSDIESVRVALSRAEQKLAAYVGVCAGDKELTGAVLPMVRAAIAGMETACDSNVDALHAAVDVLCAQAGTDTDETVQWLIDGGMARLFLAFFGGDDSKEDAMATPEPAPCARHGFAPESECGFCHDEATQESAPITDAEQAALYAHCERTPHYEVVRRLYVAACAGPNPELKQAAKAVITRWDGGQRMCLAVIEPLRAALAAPQAAEIAMVRDAERYRFIRDADRSDSSSDCRRGYSRRG